MVFKATAYGRFGHLIDPRAGLHRTEFDRCISRNAGATYTFFRVAWVLSIRGPFFKIRNLGTCRSGYRDSRFSFRKCDFKQRGDGCSNRHRVPQIRSHKRRRLFLIGGAARICGKDVRRTGLPSGLVSYTFLALEMKSRPAGCEERHFVTTSRSCPNPLSLPKNPQ